MIYQIAVTYPKILICCIHVPITLSKPLSRIVSFYNKSEIVFRPVDCSTLWQIRQVLHHLVTLAAFPPIIFLRATHLILLVGVCSL